MTKVVNKDLKHHPQQPSHTLMRQAALKSDAVDKKRVLVKRGSIAVAPKLSVARVETRRADHARKVARSKQVEHFERSLFTRHQIEPVEHVAARKPIKSITPPEPKNIATTRMLEQAIARAEHHPFKHRKKRLSRHITGTLLAIAAIVVMSGLLVSQNKTQLALEAARAKAGFAATIPTYQPAGFSLNKLRYSAGSFAAEFISNSDSRRFSVVEKPLKYLAISAGNYSRTLRSGSLTVYIDRDHNATWSSDNILFTVKADGALGDQQLLQLASSM